MNTRKYAWINLIALLLTIGVNALGGFGLINGTTQAEVSDRYQTLITPSGLTFSIWSVIYGLLLISLIVLLLRSKQAYHERVLQRISVLFWLTCIFNAAWIISFSYELVEVSVLFIVLLVLTLALITRRLHRVQTGRQWLLPLTFGLYTGWLMIATVVNIAAALVKNDWNGLGLSAEIWAMIILAVAVVLVFLVTDATRNAAIPLPVAWAYVGIFSALGSSEGLPGDYPLLRGFAIGGIIILLITAALRFQRNGMRVTALAELEQRR